MMSRSPFGRSPRHSQDPTFASQPSNSSRPPNTTRSHSHTASVPVNQLTSLSPPSAEDTRRASMAVELRGMRRLEQRRGMEENHYRYNKMREQNYNPPVDLRLLDYVTPYDNNLMCPICRCPFVDPVVLTECDHCFCRDCIRQTWNTNSTYNPHGPRGDCPSCRTPAKLGPRSATSKILVNIVDELVVKCPKSDDGCKAEVKRCEVQDHINIYCRFALIECPGKECDSPVRRKDAALGCLHYGVSCLSCKRELQQWRLETHWRSECPDRKVHCDLCKEAVFYRDLEEHNREDCPAISIPCPGKPFGCNSRSKRGQSEIHAKSCTLARLAPILNKQQERLDEQEAAQRQMSRKLEVLESGFTAMQNILYPAKSPDSLSVDRRSADSSRIPLLRRSLISEITEDTSTTPTSPTNFEFPVPPLDSALASPVEASHAALTGAAAPSAPGPRPMDLPEPFSTDFDLAAPTLFPPPDTSGGPYASPLHHLLSMHESLRDEMSRISSALSELDGRHSMQILNENLRTRDEITYLGAQVAGLQRQVHWLTSSQLQRQQGRNGTPGPSSSAMADAGAGAGVEAAVSAVSTAATALRGAARVVNVGQGRDGMPMRRGPSEEGRTKL